MEKSKITFLRRYPLLPVILFAIIGGCLIAYATRGGIGAESDTASYYSAARNLISGNGFGIYYPSGRFVYLTYWAPLYSLLLAGLSYLPASTFDLVRWLNVILFSSMILMVGGYFYHFSHSILLSGSISTLIAFSPLFIGVYTSAMSEPLYYFFGLAGLFGILHYTTKSRPIFFYLSAIAVGCAILTRYAAFAFILTSCLAIFIFLHASLKIRILKAIEFGLISMIGIGIWFWLVFLNTGTLGGRQIIIEGQGRQLFNVIKLWFINRFSGWITGDTTVEWITNPHYYKPFWISLSVFLLAASVLFLFFLKKKYGTAITTVPGSRELLIFLAFIIIYITFLVISYVYFAPFGLADRIFSPIELFCLLFLFTFVFVIGNMSGNLKISYLLALAVILFCSSTIIKGIKAEQSYPANGIGYNTKDARVSVMLEKIRELPDGIKLISNNGPYLLFHVNKFPYLIRELNQDMPDWGFPTYGSDETDAAQVVFRQGQAALILFPDIADEFSGLYGDRAVSRLNKFTEGLFLYYSGKDGRIYFFQRPVSIP